MKNESARVIVSLIEYFNFKKESLKEELLYVTNVQNELLNLPIIETIYPASKQNIDWEKEVESVLASSKNPLSKLEIAKQIESKLKYADHRMAMLNVSGVLVYNLRKKVKKVNVGKSYKYILMD